MDERRQSLRWTGSLSCRFSCGKEEGAGRLVNLSFDGAQVTDAARLPPTGCEIQLTIRPERENVTLKATVIHGEDAQFGVKFSGSRSENLDSLRPFFQL